MIQRCNSCQELLLSQAQEPMAEELKPTRIFQSVSADIFSIGNMHFLVYVDAYSGYPMLAQNWGAFNSRQIINNIKYFFREMGIPCRLRSDNGPQFDSREFQTFLKDYGVTWSPSTPHYPQSNGLAESAVKSMKSILRKLKKVDISTDEFSNAVLEFRNTPKADGFSPCQRVFGHNLRSRMPAHHKSFLPECQKEADEVDQKAQVLKEKAKFRYNNRSRSLKPLKVGDSVRVQGDNGKRWDRIGKIVDIGKFRDYLVAVPSGRSYWRNRRFLKLFYGGAEEPDFNRDELESRSAPRRNPKRKVRFDLKK